MQGFTVETPTIGPCAMSSEIPFSGKGAKNTAKGELLRSHRKTKKRQTLPEEATPTTYSHPSKVFANPPSLIT